MFFFRKSPRTSISGNLGIRHVNRREDELVVKILTPFISSWSITSRTDGKMKKEVLHDFRPLKEIHAHGRIRRTRSDPDIVK